MSDTLQILLDLGRKITKPRLLAVDDDPVFLSLFDAVYGNEIELHCTDSGEQALQLLASGYVPDFVILDLRIPGMDGIEIFRQIRKLYPSLKVKFLTGIPNDERLKEIPEIGWATIIPKPNNLQEFEAIKPVLVYG